uniref:Arrestin_N domain-containing protein n=1 Tax=Globodera pallida TaxID=36090 RepID=A0A183CTR0_GLOPA
MHSSVSGSTKLTLGSNKKKLETESYAHFAYNREVVFGAKYPVKVRIGTEELGQLRK